MKADETWRWLELWERARAHALTEEEQARLNAAVRDDPAVRDLLAQAAVLDAELNAMEALAEVPPRPVAVPTPLWRRLALPAAAALISAGLVWLWEKEPAPVAVLAKASACKWGNSALPTLEGSDLQPGLLELVDGIATLKFRSGAEVTLEAPVTLEVLSAMECRIRKGTVMAEVPPQAKGFTIHTPETKVIDYGTRFGVSAGEDGKCLVHVMEGLVEVERDGEPGRRELRAGERVDYGGFIRQALNPDGGEQPESRRWLPGPINQLGDGWQVVTTAYGRGKDSWIQSSNQKISGRESFLRVKFTSLSETLQRKAYVAFDLAAFAGRRIAEAEFVLHVEPSDLGFASLVPDAVFRVYALTDEAGDAWEEAGLTWDKAPAHSSAPAHRNAPVAEAARLLGEFTVPQGTTRGAFAVRGEALTECLNADTNGLLTLIVTRVTDETAPSGLAHAFASKENTRNTPPLLKVRLE